MKYLLLKSRQTSEITLPCVPFLFYDATYFKWRLLMTDSKHGSGGSGPLLNTGGTRTVTVERSLTSANLSTALNSTPAPAPATTAPISSPAQNKG